MLSFEFLERHSQALQLVAHAIGRRPIFDTTLRLSLGDQRLDSRLHLFAEFRRHALRSGGEIDAEEFRVARELRGGVSRRGGAGIAGPFLEAMQVGDRGGSVEIVGQGGDQFRRRRGFRSVRRGRGLREPPQRLFAFVDSVQRPADRLAVVRAQHREAQDFARPRAPAERVGSQQLVDREEIAEALRHLLAFDLQKAVVHPDVRHALSPERAAALRDLVFMVGKYQIDPAAVDIEHVLRRIV